jgi:hypothetical protein
MARFVFAALADDYGVDVADGSGELASCSSTQERCPSQPGT